MANLLQINSLGVSYFQKNNTVRAVDGVSFHIATGETLALAGESGCGKSTIALSIFRLVPSPGKITGGKIRFDGRSLLELARKEMAALRGRQIGLILQDSLSALNPTMHVGVQIAEAVKHHFKLSRKEAQKRALEMMQRVHLQDVEKTYNAYPHQLSGGQRQRIVIAIALVCKPKLLVADEPTTALDVSIQGQILDLLRELRDDFNLALLLITHDLGIVAQMADRTAIMQAGKIVEQGGTREIFTNPKHNYTKTLLDAIPRIVF